MARKQKAAQPLGTIWRADDELWAVVASVLADLDPPHRGHRPRVDQRAALDGIIYHLRTGCQWAALPAEFGDDSSVHRTMQRWAARGVFDRVWAALLDSYAGTEGLINLSVSSASHALAPPSASPAERAPRP